MTHIVIYTQASPEIGKGHVVRMTHLINLFKARGHSVSVITNASGYQYFESVGIESLDVKDKNLIIGTDITIVDHMITDNDYLKAIRPRTNKLVVIVGAGHTVTPETRWVADTIIYQCPSDLSLYNIIPGEDIVSGYDYLILHPKYGEQVLPVFRNTDFTAYFGGGTSFKIAAKIVDGLREKGYSVNWYGRPDEHWTPDLYGPLGRSEYFIGTMGMVTYEAINRGARPIVFSRSQDHFYAANKLAENKIIGSLGLFPERATNVEPLLRSIEAYTNSDIKEVSYIDGKGAYRVAREILS